MNHYVILKKLSIYTFLYSIKILASTTLPDLSLITKGLISISIMSGYFKGILETLTKISFNNFLLTGLVFLKPSINFFNLSSSIIASASFSVIGQILKEISFK